MSSVYNLEPQPNAKVILKTTAGDITLELFGKQTPLATKNFLQHCYDGYYTNTTFHRLVPGFIIQGGDPTGTGTGGISAMNDGEAFQDEFHSRLKFNRRGLLGMANEGKENTNGSQFFFTLAATPELQGRNTMFGRVEGETIYNLMKMADAELVEGTERPLYPTKITGAEVLVNPFEDVFARVREAPRVKEDAGKREVKKRKKAAGKNVLSFAAEGEEGEGDVAAPVLKKAKANPKLVSAVREGDERVVSEAHKEKKPEKVLRRKTPSISLEPEAEALPSKKSTAPQKQRHDEDFSPSSSPEPDQKPAKSALEKTNAEIAALKASMKRTTDSFPQKPQKPKNALEAMIPATSTKGRKRGKATDEKGAMDFFNAWKQRLDDAPSPALPTNSTATKSNGHVPKPDPTTTSTAEGDADDEEAALCDLHFIANCQSCKSWDDVNVKPDLDAEMDGDDDPGWMSHRLTAAKDTLGKDLEWKKRMEEVEVIDPREKARSIKEDRRKEKDRAKRR